MVPDCVVRPNCNICICVSSCVLLFAAPHLNCLGQQMSHCPPPCSLNKVLKNDEMAAESGLIDRAKAYYPSFFRWVGEARTIEKGGAAGSDCRVFRV